MGEIVEKVRYSDLPNLGLSKDLSGVGLRKVITFDHEELKLDQRRIYVDILELTLEKRAEELKADIHVNFLDHYYPCRYEVWFDRKNEIDLN